MESFRFPDDLVALQAAWLRTYDALARTRAGAGTAMRRRRLVVFSGRLYGHPYWTESGRSSAGRVELCRQARVRGWTTAA
ncbi:hypothetical protein [Streptomyces sp. NPDC047014]|uniref:hypothetical protein n=1 Tax=Streptomyces sp. NPDC047014 TaxID=3155736 RepID=UPI0033C02E74